MNQSAQRISRPNEIDLTTPSRSCGIVLKDGDHHLKESHKRCARRRLHISPSVLASLPSPSASLRMNKFCGGTRCDVVRWLGREEPSCSLLIHHFRPIAVVIAVWLLVSGQMHPHSYTRRRRVVDRLLEEPQSAKANSYLKWVGQSVLHPAVRFVKQKTSHHLHQVQPTLHEARIQN